LKGASQLKIEAETLDEAKSILQKCVHCGFCAATCPTYQLTGDELEGPRGRIYLLKEMFEGKPVTTVTQRHLDSCLTCLGCETTCPSGVQYGRLVDIGRMAMEQQVPRKLGDRLFRSALTAVLPYRRRFAALLGLGQMLSSLLPQSLRQAIPQHASAGAWPAPRHARKVVLAQGCVQSSLAPDINAASARVLDRLGISAIIADDRCCGALSHHNGALAQAGRMMKHNLDVWNAAMNDGCEAIVLTASGCAAFVKEYTYLLRDDPVYAGLAANLAPRLRDLAEIVRDEPSPDPPGDPGQAGAIAVHAPCSLQHGEKLPGIVEGILRERGYKLTYVPEAHLCCGSAGTYSLREPEVAKQLRRRKLAALESGAPDLIVTANIGCLVHLAKEAERPVLHWIELLAADLEDGSSANGVKVRS
jgi:glycolate oxidase iron-sulfur subunit